MAGPPVATPAAEEKAAAQAPTGNASRKEQKQQEQEQEAKQQTQKKKRQQEEEEDAIQRELRRHTAENGNGETLNVAPRKPNWDLKRDVSKKVEKLNRLTQKAIVELLREKLAQEAAEGSSSEDEDEDDSDGE